MSPKCFIILGVSHRVQGDKDFPGAFRDPVYADVVREIIFSDGIDFVGEECRVNMTIAQQIAQELLGAGHYLNVDPVLDEDKQNLSIGDTYCAPLLSGLPVHRWVVAENEKRERIWIDQLAERTASKGLLICGFFHAFSVAAKLWNRGFEVEARTYMPWEKLASC